MLAKVLTAVLLLGLLVQWIFASAISLRRGGAGEPLQGPPWTGAVVAATELLAVLFLLRLAPGLRGAGAVPLLIALYWLHRPARRRLDHWLAARGWIRLAPPRPRLRARPGGESSEDAELAAGGANRLIAAIAAVAAGVALAAFAVHSMLSRG